MSSGGEAMGVRRRRLDLVHPDEAGPDDAVPAVPTRTALELCGVGKWYPGTGGTTVQVLDGIDLEVAEGEFVSVVGASGCGKSTLLRLVAGLDRRHAGEIRQDGRPVVGPRLDCGIVFQEHRLLPWLTVERNVELGLLNAGLSRAQRRERVRHYLELVRLQGCERYWPRQLSGGMAQRVAIARALATRPRLLLLDEPFGALDAITRAHLQDELQRIWKEQGITMILVTHDVEEAIYLGNRVVVMRPDPGCIHEVLPVSAGFPRDRVGAGFVSAKRRVLEAFTRLGE